MEISLKFCILLHILQPTFTCHGSAASEMEFSWRGSTRSAAGASRGLHLGGLASGFRFCLVAV